MLALEKVPYDSSNLVKWTGRAIGLNGFRVCSSCRLSFGALNVAGWAVLEVGTSFWDRAKDVVSEDGINALISKPIA